ncbi:hypothetical protein FDP41_009705 [Naegleria fowleri]|uniref:Uncharacterized protein n=1 Tax=Naegleria fowleri TaxID=5763 RepID=A0A6A5BG36_NAEFO|nr:uncharacterized protein FDP41_009705 [Naegleria fowleri]KAF0972009.1 hypothetical protein FDP41_009705 [Naegleria fowleri]CAG4708683.1 unnamed protein product [Naegleria fowleri]
MSSSSSSTTTDGSSSIVVPTNFSGHVENLDVRYSMIMKAVAKIAKESTNPNINQDQNIEELKKQYELFENACDNMYLFLANAKQDAVVFTLKKQQQQQQHHQ